MEVTMGILSKLFLKPKQVTVQSTNNNRQNVDSNNYWACKKCGTHNSNSSLSCKDCGTYK